MAILVSLNKVSNVLSTATYSTKSGLRSFPIGPDQTYKSVTEANAAVDSYNRSTNTAMPPGSDSVSLAGLSSNTNTDIDQLLVNLIGGSATTPDTTSVTGGLGREIPESTVDHRIRIRAKPGMESEIYGTGPISIFNDTNGLVFPYTPQISWEQTVNYSALNLVHVNQDFNYYGSTPNLQLGIAGRFTAQNNKQAQYCFAVIHFLRTVSKMRFGQSDQKRGLPPPMMVIDGYGDYMFNQLPIIINRYNIELQNDIDYVEVPLEQGKAMVPSDFIVGITVTIQNPPQQWRDQFNLDSFRNGQLLGATKGWI